MRYIIWWSINIIQVKFAFRVEPSSFSLALIPLYPSLLPLSLCHVWLARCLVVVQIQTLRTNWRQIFNKIKVKKKERTHNRLDQHFLLGTKKVVFADIVWHHSFQPLLHYPTSSSPCHQHYLICIKNVYREKSGSGKGKKMRNKLLMRRTH